MSSPFNNPPLGAAVSPFGAPSTPAAPGAGTGANTPGSNGAAQPSIFDAGNADANDQGYGQQEQAAAVPLDPNDPLLTSETLTVVEGDAFADPPPPPAGKYRVRLKHEKVKQDGSPGGEFDWLPAEQLDRNGNRISLYCKANIAVTIVDPSGKYDGLHLQIPFKWIDTKVSQRNGGTSKAMTLLMMLRQPNGQPWISKGNQLNHRELIERLVRAVAGEPEVGVTADWVWNCQACGEEAKRNKTRYPSDITGMMKFPQKAGHFIPEMQCAANRAHGYSKARATVTGFVAL